MTTYTRFRGSECDHLTEWWKRPFRDPGRSGAFSKEVRSLSDPCLARVGEVRGKAVD